MHGNYMLYIIAHNYNAIFKYTFYVIKVGSLHVLHEIVQEFWASVHFSCFISQIMLKYRFSDFVYDLFTSVSVTKFHSYGRVKKRQKDFTVTDGVDCT